MTEVTSLLRPPGAATEPAATLRLAVTSGVLGQLERAWDAWQAERYRRGETGQRLTR